MSSTLSERALARVIAYLTGMDVPMNVETNIAALRLVEEAIAKDNTDIYDYIMDRIPERFNLPDLQLPLQMPAIRRGSIGYAKMK